MSRWYTLGPPGSGPALVGPAPFQASSVWGSRSVRLGVGPPGSSIATGLRAGAGTGPQILGHVDSRSIRLGLGYGPPSSGSATVWLHSSVVDPAPGHASGGASELPQSAPSDSDTARSAPAQVGPGPQLPSPSRPSRIRPAPDQPRSG